MTERKHNMPLPKIDGLMKPFWEFARRRQLAVQKCDRCGHVHFPPGPVCPECLADGQTWIAVSGRGKLFSWCEFHRAYWDSLKGTIPYNVSMVELDEGPVLITNLTGIEGIELRLNMPVKVVFEDVTDEIVLPVFAPA